MGLIFRGIYVRNPACWLIFVKWRTTLLKRENVSKINSRLLELLRDAVAAWKDGRAVRAGKLLSR